MSGLSLRSCFHSLAQTSQSMSRFISIVTFAALKNCVRRPILFNNNDSVLSHVTKARFLSSQIAKDVLKSDEPDLSHIPSDKIKPYHKDGTRDRRVLISPEVSIRYLKSPAFKETYRHYLVWQLHRRGFKGSTTPANVRRTCLDDYGFVRTKNPCPICRDEYLVLDYRNLDLLKHFISPFTGTIYPITITCICQMQYEKLLLALYKAYDLGMLTFPVPFREYDYKEFYSELNKFK